MPNEVKVIFTAQDTGIIDKLEKIRNLGPEVAQGLKRAGDALDDIERRTQAIARADEKMVDARLRLAQQNAKAHLDRVTQLERERAGIDQVAAANERLLQAEVARVRAKRQAALAIPERTGTIAGIDDPFAVRPDRTSAGTLSDRAVLARFNEAARSIDTVTVATDKAAESQRRIHGVTIIGTSLLRSFGVEGSRAIEVVSNQILNMGVSLQDLLSNKLVRLTLAVTAGLAFKELAESIADVNKQIATLNTTTAQFGLRGGLETRSTELKRLIDLEKSLREQETFGNFNQQKFIEQALGIERPQATFGSNFRDALIQTARDLTGGPVGLDIPGKLGLQTLAEQNKNINSTLKDRIDIENRINQVLEQQRLIEEATGVAAARRNEVRRQTAEQLGRGEEHLAEIEAQVNQENRDREEQQRHIEQQAKNAVNALSVALAGNPFERFYLEATKASEQFLEQNRKASQETLQTGLELIEQQKQLNVFKEKLSFAGGVSDLLTERAKLDAGLGGQAVADRATQIQTQKDALLNEIFTRRAAGTLGFQDQFALLAKIDALDKQSPLEQIQRDAVSRQVEIANRALAAAGNSPQARQLALEFGLNATRDIGNLTPDQIQARQKFLDQSLANQSDALRQQREREEKEQQSRKDFTDALENFAQSLSKGFGINLDFRARTDGSNPSLGTAPGADSLTGGLASDTTLNQSADFNIGGGSLSNNF